LSILTRINPKYTEKLSYGQEALLKTSAGVKFVNEFVFKHGNHLFIVGNTGSGKTQKGFYIVDWLRHTENQIWISTAKSNEILPLFYMKDRNSPYQNQKVRIIIPKGAELDIENIELENPPEIVRVATASEAWDAATVSYADGHHKSFDRINIFEFRQTITERDGQRSQWMIELFESLAERTRAGTMANIFPCSIYLDEAQWLLAGSRITKDNTRIRNSSIVIENVLEMRSAGCRFVMFAQSYKNIPPAIRENLLNTMLCRGAFVDSEENASLSYHCRIKPDPTRYRQNEGKFVYDDGTAIPTAKPWKFPLYPICAVDRHWIKGIKLKYGKKHGEYTQQEEIETECLPELGRFSAMAIPPEKQGEIISRWNAEGVTSDE
jgi:hypothetical protein